MLKPDGYVRRTKSLSLVVIAVALLSYDFVESDRRLSSDFDHVENLFLAKTLLSATVPAGARIDAVDDTPLETWLPAAERRSRFGVLPKSSSLPRVVQLSSW